MNARRYGSYSFCNVRTGAVTFGSDSRCYYLLDEGRILYFTIIQILYFNLQDPTSSHESPTRLRCCVIFSRYIALWPKRLLRISFCNKGTHGHVNSGEINLQWYQVVSLDVPRSVSFSSFGLANFGSNSRCYLPRCSTKSFVLFPWNRIELLFAIIF